MRLTDFLCDVGHPVAYYPSLTVITGSVTGTLFLCQLLYWKGKESDPDGWIYKTRAEITGETGLSRCEQETARKILRTKGLIEEKFKGLPRKLYYRPCFDKVNEEWLKAKQNPGEDKKNEDSFSENNEKSLINPHNAGNQLYCRRETHFIASGKPALLEVENQPTIKRETDLQEGEKPADNNAGNQPAYHTEITTETTSEIKKKNIPDENETPDPATPSFSEEVSAETFSAASEAPSKGEQPLKRDCPSFDKKNSVEIREQIASLRERYSQRDLEIIDKALEAFASTRKSYAISPSIILNQYLQWKKYPANQVVGGLQVYLDKDCAAQGKAEDYALGIIRNMDKQNNCKNPIQEENDVAKIALGMEKSKREFGKDDKYVEFYVNPKR